jgi:tryptophanyl-tRNA synthetase
LNDTEKSAAKKINNAFTGGRDSVEEQRKLGANPDICKVYELMRFHNPDDAFIRKTYSDCKSGKLLCGECKKNCIDFLSKFLKSHKEKYEKALPLAKKIVYGQPVIQ